MTRKAFRGAIFHCLDNPAVAGHDEGVEYLHDGLLLVDDGRVEATGDAESLLPELSAEVEVVDLEGRLIVPGFVDCHVHFPQTDIIASYGEQLLDWLDKYAFPEEKRFADEAHASNVAEFFADELLRNGTTTALVFATVHPQSVDAMFRAAQARNMRLVCGKVLMDKNCPHDLADTPQSGYDDSKALIQKWHGVDRLGYAITPRFAVTSTEEQLELAGALATEYPEVHVHSHLAENPDEVELIEKLFPWSRSYCDVYDRFGLLRERAVYAHCLYLDEQDRALMAEKRASIAFCPTSNLFLGSGLFDLAAARAAGIKVGLATDVGGGTSLNPLRTINEAYKVLQLQDQSLPAFEAIYLATLGGARALRLDDKIGNFEPGKEADFTVLDSTTASLTRRRLATTEDVAEKLFALMMLGDDRAVVATYIMGGLAYQAS